jgi:uncharacterized protein (DUF305 family)
VRRSRISGPPISQKSEATVRFSPRPVFLALGAGTLLFTACSSGSDSATGETLPPVEAAADQGSAAEFNDADVLFSQSMIPHHREAITMAEMALAPETQAGTAVQELATQIQGAQDPEIVQLTALLESWGQPLDMPGMEGMDDMDGMEGMDDMDGMMSAEEMTALAALSGPEFDSAWATAMIVHHEGAVSMAQTVKASGSNPEVLTLADAIISAQQAEIDQMKAFTTG